MPKTKTRARLADPLAKFLGYHVRRLSVRVMADLARSLTALDLNPADASVLLTIEANPGVTQSEVGKAIGILRANMAPLVSRLCARGLIEREAVDGRSQGLSISPQGEAVCREVLAQIRAHEQRMFGELSAAVRASLVAQIRPLWDESGGD